MVLARKCMVLYGKSLLAQGMATLLGAAQGIELSLADMEEVNPKKAIVAANPDVLILDINEFPSLGEFFVGLLKHCPNVKIALVDPLESVVHILRSQQRFVSGAQELYTALLDEM